MNYQQEILATTKRLEELVRLSQVKTVQQVDFAAIGRKKKERAGKFFQAFAEMKEGKIIDMLTKAGWTQSPANPKNASGTWTKKGSTIKLTIKDGTYTTTNGSEVSKPLPQDQLEAYVNQPKTQPAGKLSSANTVATNLEKQKNLKRVHFAGTFNR